VCTHNTKKPQHHKTRRVAKKASKKTQLKTVIVVRWKIRPHAIILPLSAVPDSKKAKARRTGCCSALTPSVNLRRYIYWIPVLGDWMIGRFLEDLHPYLFTWVANEFSPRVSSEFCGTLCET
jgi:hypothetical protein